MPDLFTDPCCTVLSRLNSATLSPDLVTDLNNRSLPVAHRYLFTLDLPEYWENKHADQTLEVLMSDLDPAIMDQFYMKDGVSASDVTRVSSFCFCQQHM